MASRQNKTIKSSLRKVLPSRRKLRPACPFHLQTRNQAQALISSSDESSRRERTVVTKVIKLKRHRKRNQSERERVYCRLERMFEVREGHPSQYQHPHYHRSALLYCSTKITDKQTRKPRCDTDPRRCGGSMSASRRRRLRGQLLLHAVDTPIWQ